VRRSQSAQWWAQLVGALRVHPHKQWADFPPQQDRGFARGGASAYVQLV